MTHTITDNQDGTMNLTVDFTDESVDLQGETNIKGDISVATGYVKVFENDLRNNFAAMFPVAVPAPEGGIE